MAMFFLLLPLVFSAPSTDGIEYTEYPLDSPVKEIYFCGPTASTTLLLTTGLSLYRSTNNGVSWKLLTGMLEREGQKGTKGEVGKVKKLVFSEADKTLIALIGTTGINWYSEDCGKTVIALNHGRAMDDFQFHPTVREWGLAGSWTKCSDFGTDDCKKYRGVFLTKDLGNNWTMLADYVVQFAWGYSGLSQGMRQKLPKERIYLTRSRNTAGDQRSEGWSLNMDFVKTDDFYVSSSVLVPQGNKFLLSTDYLLVAKAVEENSQEVQLYVANSADPDAFYKAELPIKKLSEHSYTLLDSSEGSMFLHVNHKLPQTDYGNIYVSDSSGRRFSISLLNNVRNSKGACDFDKVYSLEGIYIANVHDSNFIVETNEPTTRQRRKRKSKNNTDLYYKKTVISFDKGGAWVPLTPPERDSLNNKITCADEDCSLHLHSVSYSEFPPFYSTENAVGLILGVGNIGYHLSHKEGQMNTYFSRDGGYSWAEIVKGSHIYEMGDHGAILVLGDDQQPTNNILYSWNEGLTWETLHFTDDPIQIDNIIIAPGAISQFFLIYGQRAEKGVTVSIDFSGLHVPQCTRADKPGSSSSDYEVWSPNDGRAGGTCLMGRTVEYVRRKRDSECFNGEEFERPIVVNNCECAVGDFECDLGYYRDGKKCKVITEYTRGDQCEQGFTYYEEPTGYRRVPGNTCVGGVSNKYDPIKLPCAGNSLGRTGYMILTVLIIAGSLLVLTKYSEAIQEKVAAWKGVELFDKKGYMSDFDNAPEGAAEEIPDVEGDEEEFDPRK